MDSTKEHSHVEKSLRRVVNAMSENLTELEGQCAELRRDEESSSAMLQKRKAELARGEKQLRHLQSVRPTFQDDYDRLEGELDLKYSTYLERFRNLAYLEERLEGFRRRERRVQADAEAAVKEIRDKVHSIDAALIDGPKDEHGWHAKAGRNRGQFGSAAGGRGGGARGGDDGDASDGSVITDDSDEDSLSPSRSGDDDSSSLSGKSNGSDDDDF
jgi:clusterin-associated protein 1|tara:strand:+ start:61 stop:705 length:645 start_codon:yes stop_codon:yes gene_type:complete